MLIYFILVTQIHVPEILRAGPHVQLVFYCGKSHLGFFNLRQYFLQKNIKVCHIDDIILPKKKSKL